MIKLVPVKKEQKQFFKNINQKYLYEMTNFYPDQMDEKGNYNYGYFDEYFIDPKRKAFFIYNHDTLFGFVMINPYSLIDKKTDYTMAEFTIFPSYRKKGYATKAVNLIFESFKGEWEIKYNINNLPAKNFWSKITKKFNPTVHVFSENERVLYFIDK